MSDAAAWEASDAQTTTPLVLLLVSYYARYAGRTTLGWVQ